MLSAKSQNTILLLGAALLLTCRFAAGEAGPLKRPLRVDPQPVASDKSVKIDYDIVYVRLPRKGFRTPSGKFESPIWAQAGVPLQMHPGAELMVLHPDGSEEILVPSGKGSVTDPFVSFDGEWVYYSHFHDLTKRNGFVPSTAGIYKIHVNTRKISRLTDGGFSPNTGAAPWAADFLTPETGKTTMPHPVCNMGPCPLPGGKIIFSSNRNGFISPRSTNNGHNNTLQLFVMNDDGKNVEMIGHLNIGSALHPVVLRDGRVMFSTLENQGRRDDLSWGLWSITREGGIIIDVAWLSEGVYVGFVNDKAAHIQFEPQPSLADRLWAWMRSFRASP